MIQITDSKIMNDPATDRLSASMYDHDSNVDVDTIYRSTVSTDEEVNIDQSYVNKNWTGTSRSTGTPTDIILIQAFEKCKH